jgi:ABC-2 type transport system permease protein
MSYSSSSYIKAIRIALGKPLAFLYRDFVNSASYKFAFASQFVGIFLSVITFFFTSRLFGGSVMPYLEPYGGNYFSFVIVGVAFASYLQVSLESFSSNIRNAQMFGTLEAVLVTQTGVPTIIICSSLYSFFLASLRVVIFLFFGVALFGLDMGNANVPGALLILGITVIAFSTLGILSASFVMVLKMGSPLNWVFGNLSWVLGGVLYPVSVLPPWLQKVALLLPITPALEGMRMALFKGYPTLTIFRHISPLLIFTTVMLPVSVVAFQYAVNKAKTDGTLTQY